MCVAKGIGMRREPNAASSRTGSDIFVGNVVEIEEKRAVGDQVFLKLTQGPACERSRCRCICLLRPPIPFAVHAFSGIGRTDILPGHP